MTDSTMGVNDPMDLSHELWVVRLTVELGWCSNNVERTDVHTDFGLLVTGTDFDLTVAAAYGLTFAQDAYVRIIRLTPERLNLPEDDVHRSECINIIRSHHQAVLYMLMPSLRPCFFEGRREEDALPGTGTCARRAPDA